MYYVTPEIRVANRPEFFGTVPNSDAVSRVPNGSVRDRCSRQANVRNFHCAQKVMRTRILLSGFASDVSSRTWPRLGFVNKVLGLGLEIKFSARMDVLGVELEYFLVLLFL